MPAAIGANVGDGIHHLVRDLLSHTLTKNNINLEGFMNDQNPSNLEAHVRQTVDALVDDSAELFLNLGEQLHITHENMEVTFFGIANEIFVTGVNWGRIVAFLAFGGAVTTYCASKEELMTDVPQVAIWMTDFINDNLEHWIDRHGGWDGFIAFFRVPGERENPFYELDLIKWSAFALAGFGFGALLVLAARHPIVRF